jgi:hypothetical protein
LRACERTPAFRSSTAVDSSDNPHVRILIPVLRFGGWVIVVIGAVAGLVAFMAANSEAMKGTGALPIFGLAAFLVSGGVYWLLRRTAGETDDPAARYQPSSVVEEITVPVLRTFNEGSRPFTRGLGIVTLVAWLAAVVALLAVWTAVTVATGLLVGLVVRTFEDAGMTTPDPVLWVGSLMILILPIAAVVAVYRWGWRNPAIRYWLRP